MISPVTFHSKLTVTIEECENPGKTLQDWALLEKFRDSVFLSSAWILPWLLSVGNTANIYTTRFFDSNGQLVGMCFLTYATIKRRRLFSVRQLSLNESEIRGNKFIIEHNGVLHAPACRYEVYYSLLELITKSGLPIDELRINAITKANAHNIKSICDELRLSMIDDERSNAYFTELSNFNQIPDNYIASLSRNKREQIRRSIKFYGQFGEARVRYAANNNERMDFFHQLGELHQQYWAGKGKPGSFANRKWVEFHTRIISDHSDKVQLIRISFGDHILGYLYNLSDNMIAYSLQSGFRYSDNKNDRPGIISHFLVTNDYIRQSYRRYEFLAGESQYKQSLSNGYHEFMWKLIQRKTVKSGIENTMLRIKKRLIQSINND